VWQNEQENKEQTSCENAMAIDLTRKYRAWDI
jgi:hypothetical protein